MRARRSSPNKYKSLDEMFEDMDAHFLDHNAVRNAKMRLTNGHIKMKERESFSEWYPKFSTVLGPVFSCREEDRKDYLRTNLNDKM